MQIPRKGRSEVLAQVSKTEYGKNKLSCPPPPKMANSKQTKDDHIGFYCLPTNAGKLTKQKCSVCEQTRQNNMQTRKFSKSPTHPWRLSQLKSLIRSRLLDQNSGKER